MDNFEISPLGILQWVVNNELFLCISKLQHWIQQLIEFGFPCVALCQKTPWLEMPAMPATSKRACMLKEVAGYHIQWKWAHTLHIISDLLDDLPSSLDTQTYSDTSNLSVSPSSSSLTYSVSFPSSTSDCSNSSSLTAHAGHSSSSFEDFKSLEDRLLEQWNDHI